MRWCEEVAALEPPRPLPDQDGPAFGEGEGDLEGLAAAGLPEGER